MNDVICAVAQRSSSMYKVVLSRAFSHAGFPARGMSCGGMSRVISWDDGIIVAAFLRRRGI